MTPHRAFFSRIAIAALAASFITAPSTASAQTPRIAYANGQYRIAGVLTNSNTGEPLRRATIEALNPDEGKAIASALTDNDGRFSLDHLAAAKYQLSASKRGFRTAFYDEHDEFSSAIVTGPDQDTTHLQFRLTPNSILRGVITDDSGDPVANARVMLFKHPRHPALGERTAQADATTTDDTGAYEFGNLPAGEYLLAIMATPWFAQYANSSRGSSSELDVAYPVTYFDSTTEERAATPIVLAGGSHQEANITLHAVPAVHLNIPIPLKSDGTAAPIDLQRIIFGSPVSDEAQSRLMPRNNPTAMTEFGGISPGDYQVIVQGDRPRVFDLNLNSSDQQLDLSRESPINPVSGRLRMASGATLADPVTISLQRLDTGPGQTQYAADVHQGRFHLDAVPAGTWAIWATQAATNLPVISVAAGGAPTSGNMITLRDRAPELTVTVIEAETDVKGFAQKSHRGFSGAMIVLLPRNPAQWKALTRRDQSDSDGSFTLHSVAPGEYTLLAIEDGWPLDWTSPAVMSRYLPAGTPVTVTAQSGAALELDSPVAVQNR